MSAKRTSWNEFSSAMTSAVICLSTGVTAAIEEDVQEQSIPSPTAPPHSPKDRPSTLSVQPTPPPSPQPQPQAADFPFGLLQTGRMTDELDRDEGVALSTEKEEERKTKEAKNSAINDQVKGSKSVSAASITIPAATPTAVPIRVAAASTKRRKGVVEMDEEYARKLHEELNQDIDWDVAIDHVKQKAKEDPYVQRYQVMKKQTEAQARRNMIIISSQSKDQIEEEERRAIKSINETPAQKAAKRRKLNEEVAELNKHLEILPDEDNDVFTEATPLARKVTVVDYSIICLNNKPHYKIVKADGTHQMYISFLTLLKNFDRDDLESLWSIVKERFSTTKPHNFTDDFLLTTLRTMFEEADDQAQI
nr:hypothetical protein [Tanacetum cinerariifolium]